MPGMGYEDEAPVALTEMGGQVGYGHAGRVTPDGGHCRFDGGGGASGWCHARAAR